MKTQWLGAKVKIKEVILCKSTHWLHIVRVLFEKNI